MSLRALLILLAVLTLTGCGQEEAARLAHEEAKAAQQEMEAEAAAQRQADAEREAAAQAKGEDEFIPTTADLIPWKRLDTPATAEITVDWTEAADYDGQTIAVEGTIVDTHNSGKACFLNFSKEWQGTFYLAVLGSNMDDYPESPERYFLNKKVRAVGKVAMYRGRPQIVIESPLHITLLGE
jgi:predicted small lipoprotein YifL